MIVRFLVDAQLPPGLCDLLRSQGYEAVHVNEVALQTASDRQIWNWAKHMRSVLISKDEDFAILQRGDPTGPPLLWIRLGNTSNHGLRLVFGPLIPTIVENLRDGERLIEII